MSLNRNKMSKNSESQKAFEQLQLRLKTILPEEYQDCYEEVQPVSMGSASVKYGPDGKVAWDEMWDTYCDLAMAGGPPHKGVLLEPGASAEIEAQPDRYREVVEEICRGIGLTTGLGAAQSATAGWIRVECETQVAAEWLVRAIVMENVSAKYAGTALELPAGPAYRVEKEVKNVITAISKTCHYWFDHMWESEQKTIEKLFAKMEAESPLIQPAPSNDGALTDAQRLRTQLADKIREATGLVASQHEYAGWLGFHCPDVRAAIWMMRALVASNVLARREGTVLFVPVNGATDPEGETVSRCLAGIHGFAVAQHVL